MENEDEIFFRKRYDYRRMEYKQKRCRVGRKSVTSVGLAGEDAIWNPKVFGLKLDGNKVSLTYEGRDYIWMELNKPNITMNRNTPQWMMELIDKCNNVFDIAKVFGPLVLSESNISRARNSQPTESEDQDQSVQQSKGPKIH